MKIIITGGHLTPALAVIAKMPKDAEIVYIGRKYALEGDKAMSLEYLTIEKMGLKFIGLNPGRLQRKFTKYTIPSLTKIPKAVFEANKILRLEKPDVILSFGGHVAFTVCIAALINKIPFILHEQTLEAGATNKVLSRFAEKICVSWDSSLKFFPKDKTILTGNPILQSNPTNEIQKQFGEFSKKYPVITITGGSLGSHAINSFIEPIVKKLLEKFVVFHQTGDSREYKDFERLSSVRASFSPAFQERYIVKKFIDPKDTEFVYKSSFLVVSRSGMNTSLTLLLADTPCILIPLPFSQRNEQLKNAVFVQSSGLGEVLRQETLSPEVLLEKINDMVKNHAKYKNKDIKTMKLMHKNAAEKIVKIVYDTKDNFLQKKT